MPTTNPMLQPRLAVPALLLLAAGLSSSEAAGTATERWWPVQRVPAAIVCSEPMGGLGEVRSPSGKSTRGHLGATHMMVQSVAGLAARAVNEGACGEMVWIGTTNPDYEQWYAALIERLGLEERGTLGAWDLVARFVAKGAIKGYVLYSYDYSDGPIFTEREAIDHSANVASSVAGLLKAVLIEEGQEERARALGLEKLFDARGKEYGACFEAYRDRLNRRMLCTQDPKAPHNRAMAIAHQAFVVYGRESPVPEMMAWLEPLSPILGWNGGDEYQQTVLSTEHGHIQTATNWCLNLPALSAGTEAAPTKRVRSVDPRQISWDDSRHQVAFVMSDGDNVQWLMGSFLRYTERSYWNSPAHGRFPFGWTGCLTHLRQLCPQAIDYLVETQPAQSSVLEMGGGYYYPDRFGARRKEPGLLAAHARRVWAHLQRVGVRVLEVCATDLESPATLEAFRTYGREMPGLVGILAIQYSPYEAGAGKVFWVKDRSGIDIPVVTARYALWGNANGHGPRIGTPAKVARVINESVARAEGEGEQARGWCVAHCWSYFRHAPGVDEDAENMDQTNGHAAGGRRGVEPVEWCVERLRPNVKAVTPEELLWRVRMAHHPDQTRRVLAAMAD